VLFYYRLRDKNGNENVRTTRWTASRTSPRPKLQNFQCRNYGIVPSVAGCRGKTWDFPIAAWESHGYFRTVSSLPWQGFPPFVTVLCRQPVGPPVSECPYVFPPTDGCTLVELIFWGSNCPGPPAKTPEKFPWNGRRAETNPEQEIAEKTGRNQRRRRLLRKPCPQNPAVPFPIFQKLPCGKLFPKTSTEQMFSHQTSAHHQEPPGKMVFFYEIEQNRAYYLFFCPPPDAGLEVFGGREFRRAAGGGQISPRWLVC